MTEIGADVPTAYHLAFADGDQGTPHSEHPDPLDIGS